MDGIDLVVDEYSFSYLGPSPLFIDTAAVSKETGHEPVGQDHGQRDYEFLVVPYLPLPFRLAKKMISVREFDVRG